MENPTNTNSPFKPNIILITVDQMRYPMHFDQLGIDNADEFIAQFMHRFHETIWQKGVKFSNYYTAASDCTAARATIQTGLYAYQTYSMLTLTTYPAQNIGQGPPQPQLDDRFPTIGGLLSEKRQYNTPYFGKWHLSYDAHDLGKYGYDSHTRPQDYPGFAGQGLDEDHVIAADAAIWLTRNWQQQQPFFCSVNFINPHDKQWFWGAMQGEDFHDVVTQVPAGGVTSPQNFTENIPPENTPMPRYPADQTIAIPNWQNQQELSEKPATQTLLKEVFQYQMGGIFEPDEASQYTPVNPPVPPPIFYYAESPLHENWYKAIAPKEYWSKALDSYIQCMELVDQAIGEFMDGIPKEVRENSIFIFTSDHGEYASSHGLQGKGGTVYEEGIRVPLVVFDPTGRFTRETDVIREQLCSSVDLLRMIVTMGHDGSEDWMKDGDYKQLYGDGKRCNLLRILQDSGAAGRQYALHTTDEFVSDQYNQSGDPLHVIGLIEVDKNNANKTKLGVYTKWAPYTTLQSQATILYPTPTTPTNPPTVPNIEFYTAKELVNGSGDPTEISSSPYTADAQAALQNLYGPAISPSLIANELQATLPQTYQQAQKDAYDRLIAYMDAVNSLPSEESNTDTDAGHHVLARVGTF